MGCQRHVRSVAKSMALWRQASAPPTCSKANSTAAAVEHALNTAKHCRPPLQQSETRRLQRPGRPVSEWGRWIPAIDAARHPGRGRRRHRQGSLSLDSPPIPPRHRQSSHPAPATFLRSSLPSSQQRTPIRRTAGKPKPSAKANVPTMSPAATPAAIHAVAALHSPASNGLTELINRRRKGTGASERPNSSAMVTQLQVT